MDIELEASGLVMQEISDWESATAFITDRVAFNMRNLIRQLRKNYWGVFDSQIDPTTGRKKIWIPLSESLTEAVVKNIDLDTKDINLRAKTPEAIGLTSVVRQLVKNALDAINFGETLDELERNLAIDGTAVWKTVESKEDGEYKCQIIPVDLLNFYIDPQARSIKETAAVIERAVLTLKEFKSMDWPLNKEVEGQLNIAPFDGERQFQSTNQRGTTKYVEVFERWGLIPEYFITGKEKDKDLIEGHIVCSRQGGKYTLHLVEKNVKGIKPYEEAWYTRVSNRWYGKGVVEKVMMLQLWLNTIINIRINRSYVSQLGIFKIRQGSGITPQMISRLAANGAITVNNMEDIEQLAMQEASTASYKDEENIVNWSRQVTSAFEAITGESLPASTTATIGSIQARSAASQFVLIKEGVGMFLQRWIKRQFLPVLMKNIRVGDIVRITDGLQELAERIVNEQVYQQLENANLSGLFVDPAQVGLERQRAIESLAKNPSLFINLLEKIDFSEYDVEVQITNENGDVGVITQNLLTLLQAAPEYRDQVVETVADLMGVGPFKKPQMMMGGMVPPISPGQQNSTELAAMANTMEARGMAA